MSALSDLLAASTSLDDGQVSHLQRLVGEWQLLADLSFSDLLLWVPVADGTFLCAAQCRPTTGPTAYVHDQVGSGIRAGRATPMRASTGKPTRTGTATCRSAARRSRCVPATT